MAENRLYSKTHEWVRVEEDSAGNKIAVVGLTAFALEALTDLVFVDLPAAGRVVKAGGMVYVSGVGPVEPETGRVVPGGIKEQTTQCLRNLQALLEAEGSSLERIAWTSWSLRDAAEYDTFAEEWARWFPGDQPVGQTTLMPSLQRRAGFRISLGLIAEA